MTPKTTSEALERLIEAAIVWAYCPSAGGYKEGRAIEDTCEELAAAAMAYTGVQYDDCPWWSEEEMRAAVPIPALQPPGDLEGGAHQPATAGAEPTQRMIDRMKACIEGEADGLAIDDAQAKAILEYVLEAPPIGDDSAKPAGEPLYDGLSLAEVKQRIALLNADDLRGLVVSLLIHRRGLEKHIADLASAPAPAEKPAGETLWQLAKEYATSVGHANEAEYLVFSANDDGLADLADYLVSGPAPAEPAAPVLSMSMFATQADYEAAVAATKPEPARSLTDDERGVIHAAIKDSAELVHPGKPEPASAPSEGEERDFDAELLADDNGPPLLGRWHHGSGVLVSGSIRIAQWDCDTNPPDEFRDRVLDWLCESLNAALAPPSPTLQSKGVTEDAKDAARYRYVRKHFLHASDRYDGKDQTKWVMWTDGNVIDPDNGSASFDAAIDAAIESTKGESNRTAAPLPPEGEGESHSPDVGNMVVRASMGGKSE